MVVLRAPIVLRLLIPIIGSLNYCLSFSLSAYPKPNSFFSTSRADKFGMDDELKEIRRRQRERWLAAQAGGRQGRETVAWRGRTGRESFSDCRMRRHRLPRARTAALAVSDDAASFVLPSVQLRC